MSEVRASVSFWHQRVNIIPYKALSMMWAVYYTYYENFHWNSFLCLTQKVITQRKSQILKSKCKFNSNDKSCQSKSSSCWTENALGKLNLVRTLQKTHLSDVGSSIYCSLSFLRTWSRKLAINTSRSLASIFPHSLRSFLKLKTFFNNDTSLRGLDNVFLFLWCYTNSWNEQPTHTTCYCFPSFFVEKKFRDTTKKLPNVESHLRCKLDERLWLAQRHLRCCWLVIHPQVKTAVCHSDWLWKVFSHVNIKCLDFYK